MVMIREKNLWRGIKMTDHTLGTKSELIDIETLMTVIFVIVDDWYQEQGCRQTPI